MQFNKRVKQFFTFTEQNILCTSLQTNANIRPLYPFHAYFWQSLSIFVVGLIAAVTFYIFYLEKAPVNIEKIDGFLSRSSHVVVSYIPSLNTKSVRQALYHIPLRQSEWVVWNQSNQELDKSWVIMDKVIVVPKVIG